MTGMEKTKKRSPVALHPPWTSHEVKRDWK
jgi:hypothetical protein